MTAARAGRVREKVAALIVEFFRSRGVGRDFHLWEVEEYVGQASNATPGSAGRVLRALNVEGRIRYRLVSRTSSAYRIVDDGAQHEASVQGNLFQKTR
jgi:hypothetical protein